MDHIVGCMVLGLILVSWVPRNSFAQNITGRTKELCLPGNINNNNLRLTGLNRTFQSPQSDYSYHSLLCNWLITVPEGNIVKLTFDRFVLPSHCIAEYVEVFDGNNTYSKSIGKFCGFYFDDTPKHPVRSSGQYMLVRFKSVYFLGGSSEGFKATFTAENEAKEASGICRSSDGRNKVRRLSGSSGTFLSPNFPYYYPDDVRCIWTISVPAGNVVKLRFENFELNLDPEDCKRSTKTSKDYVQIHDGQVPESKELALYCGNFLSMGPSDVYSTGRYMTVIFQSISDGQLENRGFKARFEAVDPESATSDQLCFSGNVNNNNLKITASHGTLQSPLRGAVYPPDLSCDWLITVPEGKTVKLSFDRFDLQRSSWSGVCTADYVEILDGKYNYSESKGKFCAHRPDDITSSGRYMQLRFRSDSTETDFIYSGFKASFIAEDKPSTTVGVPASSKEVCFAGNINNN
ncbi:tolloid-like protein 2 [Oculina patagonica]